MNFVKLSSGAIINLLQVVQLIPPGHLQLTSGNVITLTPEDVEAVESELVPRTHEPELATSHDLPGPGETIELERLGRSLDRDNVLA